MPTTPDIEIQSLTCAAQCTRLRRIVRRLALKSLQNREAVADLTQAFDEALTNALDHGGGDGKISLRVSNGMNQGISLEVAYPCVVPQRNHAGMNSGFDRFSLTQVFDSVEYTISAGRATIRMTKRV